MVLVGLKRGKLLEIEDMDRKGQRMLGFSRNLLLILSSCLLCWHELKYRTFNGTKSSGWL